MHDGYARVLCRDTDPNSAVNRQETDACQSRYQSLLMLYNNQVCEITKYRLDTTTNKILPILSQAIPSSSGTICGSAAAQQISTSISWSFQVVTLDVPETLFQAFDLIFTC